MKTKNEITTNCGKLSLKTLKCEICGKINIKSGNNQKYCEKCRKIERRKQKTKWERLKRRENPQKHHLETRRYYKMHPEKHRKYQEKYRNNNPLKIMAHEKSFKIKIPKNQKCEICNKNIATEKHHKDYLKPLMVMFICKVCHTKIHNGGGDEN